MRYKQVVKFFEVIVLTTAAACRKEQNARSDLRAQDNYGIRSSLCYHNIPQVCGGILRFDSWSQYQQIYDCLESEQEAYIDSFISAYSNLSEEEYNDLADSIGFNDAQTLIDFENFQGFDSYRRVQADYEDQWLAAGADPSTNPDQDNSFDDEIEETLRSEDGAIWIDSTIYLTDVNGDSWVIPGGSCEALDSILSGLGNPLYKVLYNDGSTQCKNHQVDYLHLYYNDSNRMMAYKLRWNYWGGSTRTVAKMKMYRRKVVWRRNRTRIGVKVNGDYGIYSSDKCDFMGTYAKVKEPKRRRSRRVSQNWSDGEKTFESGKAQALYLFPNSSGPSDLIHKFEY